VYGLAAFAIAQRTREIAIRVTLGATVTRIVRAVLARSAMLGAVGIGTGGGVALTLSHAVRGLVPGIEASPSGTYVGPMLALTLLTTIAAIVPAWRATRIDPIVSLRHE